MENLKYIKKVEIKNLWNKYDIEWNLNEDVNILAGINGIGKTTILNLIVGTMSGKLEEHTAVDNVKITFNNDKYITYINPIFYFENLQITKEELHEILGLNLISTFDQRLKA